MPDLSMMTTVRVKTGSTRWVCVIQWNNGSTGIQRSRLESSCVFKYAKASVGHVYFKITRMRTEQQQMSTGSLVPDESRKNGLFTMSCNEVT